MPRHTSARYLPRWRLPGLPLRTFFATLLLMYAVYVARDLIEAELLLQRLADRGIPSAVQNGLLQGMLGELPLSICPTVCVLEERDKSAAMLCVREMEAALNAPDSPDLICPKCAETSPGNFEECWRCRAELG